MLQTMSDTMQRILDTAERLAQSRGYNGFSFRDIAAENGVKSASVHYHFPTKGALAAAIARRYTDRLMATLGNPSVVASDADERMKTYVGVFRDTLTMDGRMCLCGMLAAEFDAIPLEVQTEVKRFVELNVNWLAAVMEAHQQADVHQLHQRARAIFAALEGAMLVARGMADVAVFEQIAEEFLRVGLISA